MKHNQFAILAIVVSVIGFFISLFSIVPIAGIVLAVIALNQGVTGTDKTLSIVSIVLGAIGVLYTFTMVL
jgi:hypothetical protein